MFVQCRTVVVALIRHIAAFTRGVLHALAYIRGEKTSWLDWRASSAVALNYAVLSIRGLACWTLQGIGKESASQGSR